MQVKFALGKDANIESLILDAGKLNFTDDTGDIYLDISDTTRICFTSEDFTSEEINTIFNSLLSDT